MNRVISTVNEDVVSINDVSNEKIYAFRGFDDYIYKLHRVADEGGGFAFISMEDSFRWADEFFFFAHFSMKEAIQAQTNNVFEFDSLKEFCMWCLK